MRSGSWVRRWWPMPAAHGSGGGLPSCASSRHGNACGTKCNSAERAFAQQGLSSTRDRTGVLLMVSCLERQVYVLADRTLRDRVSSAQWEEVTRGMVERLKAGDLAGGLRRGIEASGRLLAPCPPRVGDNPNELSNDVIQDF